MYQNKITFKSKLSGFGASIFSTMTQLANQYGAINLAQGFPDFNCSPKLIDLVTEFMKKGYNQYAPMRGLYSLRETICEKYSDLYGADYDPASEITITPGATSAIFTIISTFIRPGDEVIVFEPCFDTYIPNIIQHGGVPVYVDMRYPDYKIDWMDLVSKVSSKTKLIILNFPHNPTGKLLTEQDIEKLISLVKHTNIMLISDEVYEHIVFDNKKLLSLSSYKELAERSFIVSSFGKTFHITGWKMGYCMAPSGLMEDYRKVHQFMNFCVNTPIQFAINEYLQDKSHYLGLSEFYGKKRDMFIKMLENSKFDIKKAEGTYFCTASYSKISDIDAGEFSEYLVKEVGVASIPVSVFYHDNRDYKQLRFCFAKDDKTLEQAAEKLCCL